MDGSGGPFISTTMKEIITRSVLASTSSDAEGVASRSAIVRPIN